DAKLAAWSGQPPPPPEALIPPDPDDKPAPFRLVLKPDGSYDVRVAEGVQFREKRDGVWHIEQVEKSRGISSAAMLRDGFDKATTYLQENSFALIKIGRDVVAAISRGVFTLFMTLMLGGYIILTHERILAFFRDLVAPEERASYDRFLERLDR